MIKHAEARKKIGFMSKNNNFELKMDAKSILKRAQKIIITNIDTVKNILPKDNIYINAFGVVDETKNFNFIPDDMLETLDNF